jgi:hypothetical protein
LLWPLDHKRNRTYLVAIQYFSFFYTDCLIPRIYVCEN